MKRLMVMLSAAAMAFGLFAADDGHVAGTGFESDAVGPFAPTSGWTIPTGDANQALTVTAYETGEAYKKDVPAKYADDETNAQFLDVRTSFGSPITCDLPEAQDMGGIYFDSLVKFTACDEDPADDSYAGAKLVVYTKEIEGDNDAVETHIIVKAGLLSGDGTTVTPTAFDCGKWDTENWGAADSWARLTVKSIGNIAKSGTVPAFAVFINGDPVTTRTPVIAQDATLTLNDIGAYWQGKLDLFPSLITVQDEIYATEAGKVSKVGFDGQGKIDDLSFTTTVPSFCADPSFFTFTWDENVAGVSYQRTGDENPIELTPDQVAALSIAIPYIAQKSCTITVTPKDGFVIDSWTGSPTTSGNAGTFALIAGGIAGGVTTKANEPKMSYSINGVPTGTATSFADLITKLGSIQGTDVVAVSLTDNVEAGADGNGYSEINFSNGIITLDLAGKTITGVGDCSATFDSVIYVNTALTIIDSVGGGKVEIGEGGAYDGALYVDTDGTATIGALSGDLGATFEGKIADNGGTISIVRGKFDDDSAKSFIAEGSVCSEEKDEAGYWVVAPEAAKKWNVIFLVNGQQQGDAVEVNDGESVTEVPEITCAAWQTPQWKQDGEVVDPTEVKITADTTFEGAPFFLDQDENDNYLVTSEADLLKVQKAVAGDTDLAAASYKQTADIDLDGIVWAGIGDYDTKKSFNGEYNGAGYVVENLTLKAKEYNGLFGLIGGEANIHDLTVKVVGIETGATGSYGGAAVIGYSIGTNAKLTRVTAAGQTDATVLTGTHNIGGIGCRLEGELTISYCTNNLNLSCSYSKIGGFAAIAATRDGNGNLTIDHSVNNGNVKPDGLKGGTGDKESGCDGAAGFVGYFEGGKVLNITNCRNNGAIEHTGTTAQNKAKIGAFVANFSGGVMGTFSGNVAQANIQSKLQVAGNNFATVSEGIATYVDGDALQVGNTYKVMSTIASNTVANAFALKADETIAFDRSLNAGFIWNIAPATGYKVKETVSGNVITYSLEAEKPAEDWDNPKTPIVPGVTKAADAWTSLKDTALAQADAAKLAAWAKDTTKGNITFDKAADIKVEAFLLDCANTDAAVAEAKAAFKVTSITQDENGDWIAKVGDAGDGAEYKNGYINIVPYKLEGAGDDAEFFQATLTLQPVTE